MWNYAEKVMENFFNPKNMGSMDNPDAVGEVGSLVCGDALKLYLKIQDGKILDAKFQTFGCGSAIASSSMLTELIKGKTIEEAEKITNQDIVDALGGLPPEKMHCSVMGREALDAALQNYRKEVNPQIEEDEGALICKCFNIYEKKLRKNIIENQLKTIQDIIYYTKAGGGCTHCHNKLQDILDDIFAKEWKDIKKTENTSASPMNTLQKIRKIEQVINSTIKPALMADGGNIELIDVDGDKVYVQLQGACSCCPCCSIYITFFVEQTLKEQVLPTLQVYEA